MTQRSMLSGAATHTGPSEEPPSADLTAFIRYCHRRNGATWPELYDEMCAVAGRREYRGWDHAELAARGLSFTLLEMPRLAGWVRAVLAADAAQAEADAHVGAATPRPQPQTAVA